MVELRLGEMLSERKEGSKGDVEVFVLASMFDGGVLGKINQG